MNKSIVAMAAAFAANALGAVETPTMGWSSWNTYHVNISDRLIMHQADLMKELGLDRLGYKYVNIDDGWFGGRGSNGRLMAHPERFPNGLKPVCDYIHSLGLKAGIYSDGGENTCGSIYDNDKWGIGVGFWNHDLQDAKYLFGENGFDFIKVDYCGGLPKGNSMGRHLDERERYTAIRRAIDSVRPGVRINVCRWNYPGTWVREIGSSWRISRDIKPKWDIIKQIIKENLYLGAYAAPGAYNDMDMLEAGRGLSPEEDHTHFAVWCFMSSPLLIGCDLERLKENPETLALLTDTNLIALNQDTAEPQGYVVKRDGECYALVRDIKEPFGLERAILFVNLGDEGREMRLDPEEFDLAYDAADVISGPPKRPSYAVKANVPAHGTIVFTRIGDRRLERRVYEGEHAFMQSYQELAAPMGAKTAYYQEDAKASGGVYAAGLGGRPGNDIVWEKVWSRKGGVYELSFSCIAERPGEMFLSVNGGEAVKLEVSPGKESVAKVTFRPGVNTVRLFNDLKPMPGIDKMTVAAPSR